MTDALQELRARLDAAATELRSGQLDPETTLALIDDCVQLAGEAAAEAERSVSAAVEPLPDLPGQLPLPAP